MNRAARALLVVLLLALPLQGAMAATRLCMAMGQTSGAPLAASMAGTADQAHAHHASMPDPGHHGAQAATGAPADGADAGAGHGDHAAGTCKLCSACCLTVAVAPPGPTVAPGDATGGDFRAVQAVAPPAIAGGLERPPRTI